MGLNAELARLKLTVETTFRVQSRGTVEEIAALEEQIGFSLDPDYGEFLQRIGGFGGPREGGFSDGDNYGVPSRGILRPLQGVVFYEVAEIEWMRMRMREVYNDGLVEDGSLVKEGWGDYLIPFCGTHPMNTFCFDYYFDADRPPVVSIYADDIWERSRRFDGIHYIADSFVEFLSLMEIIKHGDKPFQRRPPYESASRTRWTEQVMGWLGV